MPSFAFIVTDEVGLHARPAAEFVRVACRFSADVRIELGDRGADAKSLLEVLQLQVGKGAEITVSADGPDSNAALAALEAVLRGA